MSEFTRMIREALVGDETHGERLDGAEVREALARIDKRDMVVRTLGWLGVTFWTGVAIYAGWKFFDAPETDTRALVAWAVLAVGGFGGIGFSKLLIFVGQAHLGLQRDMKRIELRLAEPGRGPG